MSQPGADSQVETGSPDPCALADKAMVESVLGSPPGPPRASSAMSGDGAGLVLNCTFATEDGSKAVGYVQRLNSGRSKFESSRAASGAVVGVGTDGYWVPSKTQLLVLDGNDLVALLFKGVQIDLPTAQSMMNAARARRTQVSSNGTPP